MNLILVIGLLLSLSAFAETQHSINADYRTYPKGLNLGADYNFTQLTMGEKKEPTDIMYGFYRLGAKVYAHAQVEAYADYFPLSILQFGVSKSLTSRYYDSDQIDCEVIECRGSLLRTTAKMNLVLGYGQIFSVLGGGRTQLSLDKDVDYGIEGEAMLASRGGDVLTYRQIFVGLKKNEQIFGLYNRAAHIQKTAQDSQEAYFVVKSKIDPLWSWQVGAGTFKTDFADAHFSAFFGVSYSAGETLSLF